MKLLNMRKAGYELYRYGGPQFPNELEEYS
jgi:hypothetical protein